MRGGRERGTLPRPRRAKITAATLSRSITIRHFPHQSFRSSRLSDWSLSPHLGQVTLDPLVSRLERRTTGRPIHRALYSNCRWASLKLQPFILPRYFSTLTITLTVETAYASNIFQYYCLSPLDRQ